MTPLRKKILTLARTLDGRVMTAFQAMDLKSTLNSMDDTLEEEEVWTLLNHFVKGKPTYVISPQPLDESLVKVNVDENGKVTVSRAPFSKS